MLKTIDSTLRGHVAGEVLAARAASRRELTMIAPAFPSEGRTTCAGAQLLDGVLVHETWLDSDPLSPAPTSDLSRIIDGARPLDDPEHWAPLPGIWLADAETDSDLDAIVACVPGPQRVLWVGSPGLAAALSRASSFPIAATPSPRPARRVLVVVGSRHLASWAQLNALTHGRVVDAASRDALGAAGRALAAQGWAAVSDLTQNSTKLEADRRLADLVVSLAQASAFDALIATGGATGPAVLQRLDTDQIDIVAEPAPGIVAGIARGRYSFSIVLKAGGFGDENALVRLLGLLQGSVWLQERS